MQNIFKWKLLNHKNRDQGLEPIGFFDFGFGYYNFFFKGSGSGFFIIL